MGGGSGLIEALRLAQSQHGVLSSAQAARLGVSYDTLYRAVRSGKLEKDLPGVYRLPGVPHSWLSDLMAAHLWLDRPDACVSHRAAAALWALPTFEPGAIELSTSQWKSPPPKVVVHKVTDDLRAHTTDIGPIRVTNAGRTLIDIAGLAAPSVLERAIEDAIRRRLTSLAHLEWVSKDRSGKSAKGIAQFRALIASDLPVTESDFEARLLQAIRKEGLPPPVPQYEISHGGRVIARVDFAYPWAKVAIEADSYRYHSGRNAWEVDLVRRNRLTSLGWSVIHVTYRQMMGHMSEVAKRIRESITPSLT